MLIRLQKAMRAIWSVLCYDRYVSGFMVIGGSAWWGDELKLTVKSFQPISKSTAICYKNNSSAKIYFPIRIWTVQLSDSAPAVYEAQVKCHIIMMPDQLEEWISKIDNHPFI